MTPSSAKVLEGEGSGLSGSGGTDDEREPEGDGDRDEFLDEEAWADPAAMTERAVLSEGL